MAGIAGIRELLGDIPVQPGGKRHAANAIFPRACAAKIICRRRVFAVNALQAEVIMSSGYRGDIAYSLSSKWYAEQALKSPSVHYLGGCEAMTRKPIARMNNASNRRGNRALICFYIT